MKFRYYSIALLLTGISVTAQYRGDRDYDSEVLNYTVLNKDKSKLYEDAFFKEIEFSPEEFYTDITKLDKNYDVMASLPPKGQTAELITVIYDGFNSITPFKNNVIDGVKKIYYPGGITFQEIPYKNGKIEGIYKVYDQSGKLLSEVPYKNNLKNGLKKVYFKDPKDRYDDKEYIIEGNYKNGGLVGPITIINDKLKIVYPGDFKKGKVELFFEGVSLVNYNIIDRDVRNGEYTAYSISNTGDKDSKEPKKRVKSYSATYFNNEFNGYVEKYSKDGELLSKNLYSYGKPVGTHKSYYAPGKIRSESYYDNSGNKTGTWKNYGTEGDIIEITNYKDDKKDGLSELYQKNILKRQELYQNDKKVSTKVFDEEGKLQAEDVYANNQYVKTIGYFKDGKTQYVHYSNADKIFYDVNGTIIHTNKFKNGRQVGIHKSINYEKDNSYKIYSETEYSNEGVRLKYTWYDGKGSASESHYKNDKLHGKLTKTSADGTKTVSYYFEGKPVKEEEFKKLSEETKK
ncbi:toxin-antitoxin system YwqK family antitoxin [Chryseobacterium sp. JUb7]|uniref:toxin-antitoxin system YwqK family antitoxin n=1 Tax=Chryseobacterium sp. JUb7 TaxID=2940599 RepID=UPI0021671296|nr:hypothetical protein [Chryseobacterium sp. JUb7]MCS3529574.1 antitoxin component YwqK of YwqJK toxin-antitoxin module [Chryseobacterium sp. JUb7]